VGFVEAVECLNRCSDGTIDEMIVCAGTENVVQGLESRGVNGVRYIFKCISNGHGKEELLKWLTEEMGLEERIAVRIVDSTSRKMSLAERVFSLGKVVSLDWRIGLTMSSNFGKEFKQPFVTLFLGISDPRGKVSHHAVEMSPSEFQGFREKLKEIQAQLE